MKLTFGTQQTAVVAHWAEVFKDEHRHSHHSQAHHKHHDPNCWAVGFWMRRRNEGANADLDKSLLYFLILNLK